MAENSDRDRTTINLIGSHPFKQSNYCGYCHGNRQTYSGPEQGIQNYLMGFKANKIRLEDYELLLDKGFCVVGNYIRYPDQSKACCEVYQYRVKAS